MIGSELCNIFKKKLNIEKLRYVTDITRDFKSFFKYGLDKGFIISFGCFEIPFTNTLEFIIWSLLVPLRRGRTRALSSAIKLAKLILQIRCTSYYLRWDIHIHIAMLSVNLALIVSSPTSSFNVSSNNQLFFANLSNFCQNCYI